MNLSVRKSPEEGTFYSDNDNSFIIFVTQNYIESRQTTIPVVANPFIIVPITVNTKNKARVETQAAPKLTVDEKKLNGLTFGADRVFLLYNIE